jgi:hypothetical protein
MAIMIYLPNMDTAWLAASLSFGWAAIVSVPDSSYQGVRIISPQQDQQRVIEFFGQEVLPRVR